MNRPAHCLFVLTIAAAIGCGTETPNKLPPNFGALRLSKRQWAIEVPGMDASKVEAIQKAVESAPGVGEGTVLVNPEGQYVVYRVSNTEGPDGDFTKIRDGVVKKLKEIGLSPGQSKTQEKQDGA